MKNHAICRCVTIVLLLVFLCSLVALPAFAADDETRVIHVGSVDIDNFLSLKNGIATGYGADFLREIGGYTGWTFEYVTGTWSQCLQWLKNGEIDLLCPAEYSEERAVDFLYSSLECCIDYVALLTVQDSGLYYEDYENYNGMTVGMIIGNYLNDCFAEYASENGFSYKTEYFETGKELSEALRSQSVDAIVTGNLDIAPDFRIVAKFDFMPAYFITSRERPELMKALDDAMYRINLENPYFASELYDTYYAPFVAQSKVFTREESEYIAQTQPLRVVCDSDNYPFEWYDAGKDEFRGIDIDTLELIAENSGLKFEYVYTDSLLRSWEAVRDGEADIIAGVYLNEMIEDSYRVDATISYTEETGDAVCRRGSSPAISEIRTVALKEAFIGTAEYLRRVCPDWRVITFPDSAACLKAVENGEADITFLGECLLQTEAVLERYPRLSVLPGVVINVPITMGVSKEASPLLLSVLNKSIHSVPRSEKAQIVANNTVAMSRHSSISDLVREHPIAMVLVTALLLVGIACVVFLSYHWHIHKKYAASLEKKNEELFHANQATSVFFSQLSHDMRTPMNAVLSFSQFGIESDSPEETKEYFQKIQNSGQYLLTLINDTLELSKIDTGKMELYLEPCIFSSIRATLENTLMVEAKRKNVTFGVVDETPKNSAAMLDKMRLQQILMNLLNNAIKFTPPGGQVSLQMSCSATDSGKTAARFVVSDTGIGMSREFISDKLYQPFEQERREESGSSIGTGLGLSIVRKLVELMDGTISCESEIGKGTTFSVEIPVEFTAPPQKAASEQDADYSGLSGKRILLCEDHPINREIIEKILLKINMKTETAANGKEGVEKFAQSEVGRYDAVLMDLRMPVMDGLAATREIRGLSRMDAETIPIIAITANVFASDIEQCVEAGMNAHLAKPIEPESLFRLLDRLIIRGERD